MPASFLPTQVCHSNLVKCFLTIHRSIAPNAITVGSINSIDQMAYYSDWGQCMDLYAPGENVYSACVDRSDCSWDPSNNDRYRYSSGNSFAAPHVVG